MSAPIDVLAVLDRFANSILPGRLWDGNNRYCNQPGREGSEYANDLASLCEARAAVAELIEAAGTLDRIERGLWHERGRQEAVTKLCAALAKVQP